MVEQFQAVKVEFPSGRELNERGWHQCDNCRKWSETRQGDLCPSCENGTLKTEGE